MNQAVTKLSVKFLRLVQLNIQNCWNDTTALGIKGNLAEVDLEQYPPVAVNEKGYITFPRGKEVKWLGQKIVIPHSLEGYPLSSLCLRLVLTWWAEDAQIFVNGELVQQGDLFDSSARVLITNNAQPGQAYVIVIRLVSPYHDIGALMRSHLLYEKTTSPHDINSSIGLRIDPGLIADEITVLFKYLSQFEPERLEQLATILEEFDWVNISHQDKFESDLVQLRSQLLPLAKNIKQRCFNLLGHAHLDMAWLWTMDETYEVAERTFKSVLNLQQDFPDLTFGHTSPALYEWLEHHRPQLFAEIKRAVSLNKWEILGGMWIEPETNLVSGESLVRQLLYGQRYYQKKFGNITKVAWLPDSFGFTWQLPQIFKQCGIEYFVTGKLHWNDSNKFPLGCFWWKSPDGTELLTLMSPPNVTGVMDTNPITMANYAIDWEIQTGLQDIFWLPGVGDHGGGPTRDMLEVARKWHNSPFFPEIKFSKSIDYLNCLTKISASNSKSPSGYNSALDIFETPDTLDTPDKFPVWNDELYLELHRGCYTVHADQKKYNRYCERLLYQAELWSTLATAICQDGLNNFNNPSLLSQTDVMGISAKEEDLRQKDSQQLIEVAWKKVLFNQFHDILPGTSIPEVFTQANQDWKGAIAIGESVLKKSLQAIADRIKLPQPPQDNLPTNAQPIVIFNSLNWERSQVVAIEDQRFTSQDLAFGIWDDQGKEIQSQDNQAESKLSFLAQGIPGVGYRLYWLCSKEAISVEQERTYSHVQHFNTEHIKTEEMKYELENQYLKIVVNPNTGNLDSIFDRINNQELLSGQGNELQAFEDQGQYWDAWNIDPEYEQKQLPPTELQSIAWINTGLTDGIRVVKILSRSTFTQDYILETDSAILKIANTVDWQETHVMVKAAFPVKINSSYATYEIPCGAITRTTQPQTAEEKAKWEVSALNWADLTDDDGKYGVSLLNDCKYGYDAKPNQLRLTLLRSSVWPDPVSDKGMHHFTYSIYPHRYDWRKAKTVHKGYELNTPLQIILPQQDHSCNNSHNQRDNQNNQLSSTAELLNLSSDNLDNLDNLILMALKRSPENKLIMRCYEAHGEEANLIIKSDLNLKIGDFVDCLEAKQDNLKPDNLDNPHKNHKIQPYKITTCELKAP